MKHCGTSNPHSSGKLRVPITARSTAFRTSRASSQRSLLFSGETKLTAPIFGTSSFAADFAKLGPRDPKGRSLRDLDLQTRLFKHPLSFTIYSELFDALPSRAKFFVFRRMHDVLMGKDSSEPFAHLSLNDRQAILEIVRATKPEILASADAEK